MKVGCRVRRPRRTVCIGIIRIDGSPKAATPTKVIVLVEKKGRLIIAFILTKSKFFEFRNCLF